MLLTKLISKGYTEKQINEFNVIKAMSLEELEQLSLEKVTEQLEQLKMQKDLDICNLPNMYYFDTDKNILISAYPHVMAMHLEKYEIAVWLTELVLDSENLFDYGERLLWNKYDEHPMRMKQVTMDVIWISKNMLSIIRGKGMITSEYCILNQRKAYYDWYAEGTEYLNGLFYCYEESNTYFDSFNDMLVNQVGITEKLEDIYIECIKNLDIYLYEKLYFSPIDLTKKNEKMFFRNQLMCMSNAELKLLLKSVPYFVYGLDKEILTEQKYFLDKYHDKGGMLLLATSKGFFPQSNIDIVIQYCEDKEYDNAGQLLRYYKDSNIKQYKKYCVLFNKYEYLERF